MALFTLKLNDNSHTPIDFLGAVYRVDDGGFDIGTPQRQRELAVLRPGFYVPITDYEMYREATLKFSITGATRTAVLQALNDIQIILRGLSARVRVGAGRRCELSYTWEGATDITYFEVYAGEISFPGDVLSVAKVHMTIGGNYVLPECELRLVLSAGGYGVSLYNSPAAIPLYRTNPGSKTTSGLTVQNPGTGVYNYVTIEDIDVDGSLPMITKIVLDSGGTYSTWKQLYIGHQVYPFPTKILFDDTDLSDAVGTPVADTGAEGDSYRSATYATQVYGYFSDFKWQVGSDTVGNFLAFLHMWYPASTPPSPFPFHLAIGVDDYTHWGVRYVNDWVSMTASDPVTTLPLGQIQLPPNNIELANVGTLDNTLSMGLFVSTEPGGGTLKFDYLSLLPIGNGVRSWRARQSYLTGTMIDDDWKGLTYLLDGVSAVSTPFFGLMEPIKLEPGVTQRLYFLSAGLNSGANDQTRQFIVKVYGVPTYAALAM